MCEFLDSHKHIMLQFLKMQARGISLLIFRYYQFTSRSAVALMR